MVGGVQSRVNRNKVFHVFRHINIDWKHNVCKALSYKLNLNIYTNKSKDNISHTALHTDDEHFYNICGWIYLQIHKRFKWSPLFSLFWHLVIYTKLIGYFESVHYKYLT